MVATWVLFTEDLAFIFYFALRNEHISASTRFYLSIGLYCAANFI